MGSDGAIRRCTYPDVRAVNVRDEVQRGEHGDEADVDFAEEGCASCGWEGLVEGHVLRGETQDFEGVEFG